METVKHCDTEYNKENLRMAFMELAKTQQYGGHVIPKEDMYG